MIDGLRRRSGRAVAPALLLALTILIPSPAWSHGASKGLHLHVEPEPAAHGGRVTVEVNAAEPMHRLEIEFVDGDALVYRPRTPARELAVLLRVPLEAAGETVSLHAEVRTAEGRTLRAAAVVVLAKTGNEPRIPPSGN